MKPLVKPLAIIMAAASISACNAERITTAENVHDVIVSSLTSTDFQRENFGYTEALQPVQKLRGTVYSVYTTKNGAIEDGMFIEMINNSDEFNDIYIYALPFSAEGPENGITRQSTMQNICQAFVADDVIAAMSEFNVEKYNKAVAENGEGFAKQERVAQCIKDLARGWPMQFSSKIGETYISASPAIRDHDDLEGLMSITIGGYKLDYVDGSTIEAEVEAMISSEQNSNKEFLTIWFDVAGA